MGTIRQQKLAQAIVKNIHAEEPLNKGELLESVGYAKSVAEAKPTEILEQKGVQEELIQLGFDPNTAKQVVSEILIGGENDNVKLKAADMIFKVHGTYAPEKSVNLNVEVEASSEIKRLTSELNAIYRGAGLPSDGGATSPLGEEA